MWAGKSFPCKESGRVCAACNPLHYFYTSLELENGRDAGVWLSSLTQQVHATAFMDKETKQKRTLFLTSFNSHITNFSWPTSAKAGCVCVCVYMHFIRPFLKLFTKPGKCLHVCETAAVMMFSLGPHKRDKAQRATVEYMLLFFYYTSINLSLSYKPHWWLTLMGKYNTYGPNKTLIINLSYLLSCRSVCFRQYRIIMVGVC